MRVQVGLEIVVESSAVTPTAWIVRPRMDINRVVGERRVVDREVAIHSYRDSFGNHVWRWNAPVGETRLQYDALVDVAPTPDPYLPDLPGTPIDQLPDELLLYTLPSRYCPSDIVLIEAWDLFGHTPDGWARVQAICDWIHANVVYGVQTNTGTTGYETYRNRGGVCRDFAHLAVMFCRALNIPARYVCGYLPDIGVPANPAPMDFHAWFEAYLGGGWRTFDARHNQPRIGRITIARGRDAVDTAFMTSYGDSRLTYFEVRAEEVDPARTLETPSLV